MPAIVWMGPVSAANLAGVALPPGWTVFTVGDIVRPTERPRAEGIKPSDFRAWAAAKLGPRPLAGLLELAGASSAILASFSAGHGLLELLLADAPGDARILGALAADSYYGLAVKPGYLAHGQACVKSGDPFWLTSSRAGEGPRSSSATQSIEPFAAALELRPQAAPAEVPPPVRAFARGGVLWLDYGQQGDSAEAHRRQATEIAPAILSAWVAGVGSSAPRRRRRGRAVAALATAVALAWALED